MKFLLFNFFTYKMSVCWWMVFKMFFIWLNPSVYFAHNAAAALLLILFSPVDQQRLQRQSNFVILFYKSLQGFLKFEFKQRKITVSHVALGITGLPWLSDSDFLAIFTRIKHQHQIWRSDYLLSWKNTGIDPTVIFQ